MPPVDACTALGLSPSPAVIIIDDEPPVVKALSSIILHHQPQISIEPCSSSRAAVQKILASHFDAVLTDLVMPEFNGWQVLERVRDTRPCTPVLMVTGTKQAAIAAKAFEEGAFDFLGKPIDRQGLVASVSLAIKTRRLQRRIALRRVYIEQVRGWLHRARDEGGAGSFIGASQLLDSSMAASVARFQAEVTRITRRKNGRNGSSVGVIRCGLNDPGDGWSPHHNDHSSFQFA